jgi:hypothetical protein
VACARYSTPGVTRSTLPACLKAAVWLAGWLAGLLAGWLPVDSYIAVHWQIYLPAMHCVPAAQHISRCTRHSQTSGESSLQGSPVAVIALVFMTFTYSASGPVSSFLNTCVHGLWGPISTVQGDSVSTFWHGSSPQPQPPLWATLSHNERMSPEV